MLGSPTVSTDLDHRSRSQALGIEFDPYVDEHPTNPRRMVAICLFVFKAGGQKHVKTKSGSYSAQ